ncbi:hypothetical protein KUTeg_010835 [Tegillarca granosa]|uniref:C1q domain-containing protein n=1 Tax=Tegillarca granosa TaxID=220873 RepID=A0ABQ9F250_TEGGR|nr:hypothetical protein KUTeg_010835 [Tegillarca granosa]
MKSQFIILFMGIIMIALVNSQVPRGNGQNMMRRRQRINNSLSNPGTAARPKNNLNNMNTMNNFNQNGVRPPRTKNQNFNNQNLNGQLNKRIQSQWQNQPVETTPGLNLFGRMGGSFGLIFGDLFNAIVEERVRGMRQDDKISDLQTEVAALRKEVNTLTKEMAIAKPLSQQLSDLIQSKSRKIAFVAELKTGKTFTPGTKIVFETAKFNKGQGYNTSDGIFYAPADGLYLFSAFIIAEAKGYHAQILKNDGVKDVPVGYMYTHDNNAWGSASTTIVASLKRGDKVWVNSFDKSLISNWSTFSGSLIR